MGKRRGGAAGGTQPNSTTTNPSLSHSSISLREETTGKLQTKGGSRNPKSFLRLEHLQNLAVWATKEASVPSLGAFFGRQFAAAVEALGAPPDPNVVSCQRCETILHPGFNCTVRVEKAKPKSRCRWKKTNVAVQNNVVYKCHFCLYCNLKRGTPRGHMKELCPPKKKSAAKVQPAKPLPWEAPKENGRTSSSDTTEKNEMTLPVVSTHTSMTNSPVTPAGRSGGTTLLDAKRRQRNKSTAKVPLEMESKSGRADSEQTISASQKRKRRKSWTSLKEIAEEKHHVSIQNIANLQVPFFR